MREAFVTFGLAVAIFLSIPIQEFLPPIAAAEGARIYLVPVFFCYGACVLPFASMIVLAALAGFLSDFASLQIVGQPPAAVDLDVVRHAATSVEISPGWSILLFVAIGLICQGLRPLVFRGHWWIPAFMSAVATVAYLALQFLMITVRRFAEGGFFWSETVAWRILAPGLVASLCALVLVLLMMIMHGALFTGRRPLRDF